MNILSKFLRLHVERISNVVERRSLLYKKYTYTLSASWQGAIAGQISQRQVGSQSAEVI